jgi:uncharacterized membrane protein YphA (DoxX/SURF4 family)
MNVLLWTGQALLAAIFLVSGSLKISQSKERMIATGQTGVAPFPLPLIRVVAACELLGAAGVVLPWLTGIAPILTPLAALGFAPIMVGAAISHYRLKEPLTVAANLLIMTVAILIAVGRLLG